MFGRSKDIDLCSREFCSMESSSISFKASNVCSFLSISVVVVFFVDFLEPLSRKSVIRIEISLEVVVTGRGEESFEKTFDITRYIDENNGRLGVLDSHSISFSP